jgi:hypothetical protein
MADTLLELGDLIGALKTVRADADEFHLRAQKVEDCLQKIIQSDTQSKQDTLDQSGLSKISQKLMQEIWFAKESSELRLAANLHAYL